ncbi:hypothetical protein BDW02DRAFT_578221 [Decorospora gaudefroyi]|uniref:Uncharacterized protein n=1 Tax=Decorospora gaudefroyi TaxID=184978 RepID=A0A6A5KJJ3_9PLEO|nr:hypothetical protein BDW02DRAFT_578221 [Decorospora gaudefroyi]
MEREKVAAISCCLCSRTVHALLRQGGGQKGRKRLGQQPSHVTSGSACYNTSTNMGGYGGTPSRGPTQGQSKHLSITIEQFAKKTLQATMQLGLDSSKIRDSNRKAESPIGNVPSFGVLKQQPDNLRLRFDNWA